MVGLRNAFSLISSLDHFQKFSLSQISGTPWAGFKPAQNLRHKLYPMDTSSSIGHQFESSSIFCKNKSTSKDWHRFDLDKLISIQLWWKWRNIDYFSTFISMPFRCWIDVTSTPVACYTNFCFCFVFSAIFCSNSDLI